VIAMSDRDALDRNVQRALRQATRAIRLAEGIVPTNASRGELTRAAASLGEALDALTQQQRTVGDRLAASRRGRASHSAYTQAATLGGRSRKKGAQ